MRVLHVSPTYYSSASVIGGGEKYPTYMIRALGDAARRSGVAVENGLLAIGETEASFKVAGGVTCEVIPGRPWDPHSVALGALRARIGEADVVVVHQGLCAFGLFVASHARLAGRIVIGMDHGGGEHPLVGRSTEVGHVFDLCLAQSQFAALSFVDVDAPVSVCRGPVDTDYYAPSREVERVPGLVVSVGRLLPHKGFDRVIRALPANLRLVIAGNRSNPEYFDHLHGLIRESQAQIAIQEGLPDDEVRTLMRQASVVVHASTHLDYRGTYYAKPELLGLVPLEALSCGTPTLVSTAGSLGELGSVTGCSTFSTDGQLAELLGSRGGSAVSVDRAEEIHRSVASLYGMGQFGDGLLNALLTFERPR